MLFLHGQKNWPARFQSPPPTLQQLPPKDDAVIWSSRHFIIVCEIELTPPRMRTLAQTMESVPLLFQQLPLPLWVPPEAEKAVVRLCRSKTSFVARGAPSDAAGYYQPRSGEILIRGDLFLNPPQARPSQLQLGPNEDLLVHELTHLAMHQYGASIPAWLSEGLAEYFAACHLGKGLYDFSQSSRLLKLHIEKFYPIERFPHLILPSPSSLAGSGSRDWLRNNRTALPEDRYRPYATALLLAHYHLEGGTKRRTQLTDYLNHVLEKEIHPKPKPLLENPAAVSGQLVNFWKPKGLLLEFK